MKLNHKIEIDLLEVFKTGKFDYVKIGKTKDWILNNFPEPDDFEAGTTLETATFWSYGNIEFYFQGDHLIQIYVDNIDSLGGGPKLSLKKWIINEPEKLKLHYVIEHLANERIDFNVKHLIREHISQTSIGLPLSGTYLNFQPEYTNHAENELKNSKKLISPYEHRLQSISIIDKEEFQRVFNI